MRFELDEHHRNIPEEDLINDLQSVARQLKKKTVTVPEYKVYGKYGATTYQRRFGSWFKSLDRAGLERTRNPFNIPEEDLFRNLEEVWEKLGKQPKYSELVKPLSKYSVGTYEKRFHGWRNALKRFVAFVNENGEASNISIPPREGITKKKTSRTVNWRLRFIIMRRDSFKCKICGKSPAIDSAIELHVDHIHPWAKGGETIPENLQTLCSQCNIGKSDLLME